MNKNASDRQKSCFVIAPIGEVDSKTRKRSDVVLRFIIAPAVAECGYAPPLRADQIGEPGIITSQVIERVVEDDLVIADLTEENPNVFYELALRHAARKPLVQIIEKGHRIPFDLAGYRTIELDHRDLESVDLVKGELRRYIIAVEQDSARSENPISAALDLRALRTSGNPVEASIAELAAQITLILRRIEALDHNLAIFDKMKAWESLDRRLDTLLGAVASLEAADMSNIDGVHSLDDVMSKLEELEASIQSKE